MTTKPTVIVFDGNNYDEWERATTFHLKSKLLYRVISQSPPATATALDKWNEDDMQAQGKIGERVDPKFYLRGINSASDQWEYADSHNTPQLTSCAVRGAPAQLGRTCTAHLNALINHHVEAVISFFQKRKKKKERTKKKRLTMFAEYSNKATSKLPKEYIED